MKDIFKITLFTLLLSMPFNVANAEENQLTLVALGDSTTAGTPGFEPSFNLYGAGRGNIESQYAYWLMESNPHWKVLNRGINGERSDQILSRFTKDVIENKADIVIVLAGVNDIFQGKAVEDIQGNIEKMHLLAKENEIDFLVCTILPYDIATPQAFEKIQIMNRWILEYSKESNLPACDTFKATSHPKNSRMLVSTADHIHPDAEAYKKMAQPIEKALLELEKNNAE